MYGQYGLGRCYEYVNGAEKNPMESGKWYRKAADQGHPNAQLRLGDVFYQGKYYKDAVTWYQKAAKQDLAAAQYQLGLCYECGNGVMKSKLTAKKWYKRAADQGHEKAKAKLKEM